MDFRADLEPGDIEGFWFAIDRSILREHGKPLHGPPPTEIFAPIARATIAPVLAESMRWHRGDVSTDAVLNTARSQHFLDTGHWISKLEARARLDDAATVTRSFKPHVEEEQAAQDAHPRGTAAEARAGDAPSTPSTSATRRLHAAVTARARSATRVASPR